MAHDTIVLVAFMMLCNGGLIVLRAPGQIVVFPENEAERPVKDLETTSSYDRRVIVSQVYRSNFDKFRAEPASQPTGLGANPVTFKEKPLGSENVRFKAPEPSSKESKDRKSMINKGVHNSDLASKKEFQQSSGIRHQLDEQHSSGRPPFSTQESDDEDWRSLSRVLASGQKVSAISNHELMRIAELRFSTDLNEGDSGSHVVLLQKALFWLGYMSKQSDITGYFGTETKQALREFQEAHGVSQTGAWGSVSKQALWHTISAEILHRVVDEKASKPAEALNSGISGKSGVSSQVWQTWNPAKLADVFTAARPEGEWRLLSAIALLVVGMLFGLFISKVSSHSAKDVSVKRRIVRSTEPENSFSPLKNEKLSIVSSNGAAVVDKISQFHSNKPSHITEVEAVGQVDAEPVPQKKVTPNLMYVSSLGHGVQHDIGKKAAYGTGIPSQRASSSKPGADSMRRGKQSGSWSRPTRDLEDFSRTSKNGRPEPLSSSRQETAKFQREGSEPIENSQSMPKSTLASRRDELARPKKLDNEFSYPKSDGAVTMHGEDEPNVRKRIEELRITIEAAEQNGQAAVDALAEERKRSLELEEKISRQRESAAALEEEVRVLKESHDALLDSLRKKIGSSTRGASLLYQNFKGDGNS